MVGVSQQDEAHSETVVWDGSNELDVGAAARSLREGGLVAFPTETVYGLGANAFDTAAVDGVYRAKGRPSDNPLIVHVPSTESLRALALVRELTPPAAALAKALWPGPLTLVLPLRSGAGLAPAVTAGLRTVAVRVPRHPVAAALLAAAGVPVAAPSANASGRPSPTSAAHVLRDLRGRIAGVVDGGVPPPHAVGVESTVVDATDANTLTILRPGSVGREALQRISGVPVLDANGTPERPRAPGMKYRHYAPSAPLRLVQRSSMRAEVDKTLCGTSGGMLIGVLADAELCAEFEGDQRVVLARCGRQGDSLSAARELYAALRSFDDLDETKQVGVILAVRPEDARDGVALAVLNRLTKAAGGSGAGGTSMAGEAGEGGQHTREV